MRNPYPKYPFLKAAGQADPLNFGRWHGLIGEVVEEVAEHALDRAAMAHSRLSSGIRPRHRSWRTSDEQRETAGMTGDRCELCGSKILSASHHF